MYCSAEGVVHSVQGERRRPPLAQAAPCPRRLLAAAGAPEQQVLRLPAIADEPEQLVGGARVRCGAPRQHGSGRSCGPPAQRDMVDRQPGARGAGCYRAHLGRPGDEPRQPASGNQHVHSPPPTWASRPATPAPPCGPRKLGASSPVSPTRRTAGPTRSAPLRRRPATSHSSARPGSAWWPPRRPARQLRPDPALPRHPGRGPQQLLTSPGTVRPGPCRPGFPGRGRTGTCGRTGKAPRSRRSCPASRTLPPFPCRTGTGWRRRRGSRAR
jgi:hypothetical protein